MDDNIVTVSKFLKKVDIDYEKYGENIIGDISYNAIKKLLSDVIYLKEENDKLRNIKNKDYSVDVIRENTQLRKENFDLKNRLSWRINYCQELEKDLFENCENYVISKDRIKERIKKYAKLSDNFYSKWKNLSPFDEDYKNIRDKGMCYDAIVNALQELLEGRK